MIDLVEQYGDVEVFLGLDHSQLEIRVLAQMSRDKLLIELIQSGQDIHSAVGHVLTGIPVEKIKADRETRTAVKGIHFGIIFGLSAKSLYYTLKVQAAEKGEKFTWDEKKVKDLYDDYFIKFSGVKAFIERQVEFAEENGYVETLFGFRRECSPFGAEDRNSFWKNQAVNCVDYETEVLTMHGWKKAPELSVRDYILTKDPVTGWLEWQRIKKLNLHPDYDGKLYELASKSFSAVCTPNHRWLVYDKHFQDYVVKTTDRLSRYGDHGIPRLDGRYRGPKKAYISDDLVRLIGWFLTDGYRTEGFTWWNHSSLGLCQSMRANPHKVAMIDELLERLGVTYTREVKENSKAVYWTIRGKISSWIFHRFPDRTLTPEFLVYLPLHQLQILYDTMVLGDGTVNEKGRTGFCSGKKSQIDAFHMLATLLGQPATVRYRDLRKYKPRKSAKMPNIPKSTGVWGYNALGREKIRLTKEHFRQFNAKLGVWCPTVKNGFFVARRKGTVYITGNSPIQGTAHQLILISLAVLYMRREAYSLWQNLSMEIHDSLVSYVKLRDLPHAYRQGVQLLEKDVLVHIRKWFPKLNWQVPLKAEGKAGFRFGVMVPDYAGGPVDEFLEAWCQKNRKFDKELRAKMEAAKK